MWQVLEVRYRTLSGVPLATGHPVLRSFRFCVWYLGYFRPGYSFFFIVYIPFFFVWRDMADGWLPPSQHYFASITADTISYHVFPLP